MKETIRLCDISPGDNPEEFLDRKQHRWEYQKQIAVDGEKCYCDYEVVFKRLSDNTYFTYTYTDFGRGETDILDQTAHQVTKKQKLVDYYE